MARLLTFPKQGLGCSAASGATWFDIWRERARYQVGRLFNALGVPGPIQPVEIQDAVTGQHVIVVLSPLFIRIQIDGRDYYFRRISGKFDGTGSGCQR